MSPVLGNLIVIAILAVIIFFSGRKCIQMMKDSISGKGCSGRSGCSSAGQCSCGCASCSSREKKPM
ncbi:MAG TPA: FeoB-associated Cys-rich membrane protein [Lachnoclostridium sp.]|nr:FeoB-associated Cys-rich membrane protein [Lachnoclostridium sp.]